MREGERATANLRSDLLFVPQTDCNLRKRITSIILSLRLSCGYAEVFYVKNIT